MRYGQNIRRNTGSMIVLTMVMTGVISTALIIALSFATAFMTFNRMQNAAEQVALAGATVLNLNNRVGQINDMTVRSRQLVFASRTTYQQVLQVVPESEKLALKLLDESRESAMVMNNERQLQARATRQEAEEAMQKEFRDLKGKYGLSLPWLSVGEPRLRSTRVGKIAGVESNSRELTGFDELAARDRAVGFATSNYSQNLYKGSVDARLPGADGDLAFRLSSLPAPVDKVTTPARITRAEEVDSIESDLLPSATAVEITLDVRTVLGVFAGAIMHLKSAAASGGATEL